MSQPDLEIEVVNPDMVIDDGSVEITLIPGAEPTDMPFEGNLAEVMEENDFRLSEDLIGLIDSDIDSPKTGRYLRDGLTCWIQVRGAH